MATYTKRGNTYRIRASIGYTVDGKQVMKSTTWTPAPGMTPKQTAKELTRQMVMFEEACKGAAARDGHIKFETFTAQWFAEYVTPNLRKRTAANYKQLLPRINDALGHLYLDRITPMQIQQFVNSLAKPGANQNHPERGLSPKSIKNHLGVISAVFAYAVRMQLLNSNPAAAVSTPKAEPTEERPCYTLEQAQAFLDALTSAPLRWQVFFSLAMFGGFRREELCGFEFQDFDMERETVTVRRTSLYTPQDGIFTDTTKTAKSQRTLKLPGWVFGLVRRLQAEQSCLRLAQGSHWRECGRLFTKQDGSPIGLQQPYQWLSAFCKRNGLPFYGIHQFRHLNASLLIYNGEDVRTVSAALGHSQPSTTLNIYAHTFAQAQAQASEALAEALPVKFKQA